MADDSRYEESLTPTIYFFVDKQSDEVVAIHMYSIFGISYMDQSIQDWRPASREEDAIYKYIYGGYHTYKYDWSSEPYDITDPSWDPEDIQDWYPKLAKAWGKGELVSAEDLKPYASKLEENFISDDEQGNLS